MKAVRWVVVLFGACLGRVRLRGVNTVAALAVNERSWKRQVEAVPLTSMHCCCECELNRCQYRVSIQPVLFFLLIRIEVKVKLHN